MAQSHFYPCNETKDSLCQKCNAGLTSKQGTNGTNGPGATSGKDNSYKCEAYCNASCNIKHCETSQAYCSISHEYIKDHGDVGAYPGTTIKPNDFIHERWTVKYWNSLIGKLEVAEGVGKLSSQGAGPGVTAKIEVGEVYTASLYNEVRDKIAHFNSEYNKVQKEDLITATIANAIGTAYNKATFGSSVCDVCNSTSSQSKKTCICNCPKCSSCPSCPTCPSCSACAGCSCSNCQGCSCSAGPSTEGGSKK